MSFSSETKKEMCRAPIGSRSAAVAEAYGVLLYCNTFSFDEIKIVTGSNEFAKRLPKLFSRAFGMKLSESPDMRLRHVFSVTDKDEILKAAGAFGYDKGSTLSHRINLNVLEDENTRESFVRGAFLTSGSVTDPRKRYHLEIATDHYRVSREILPVLQELGLSPKNVSRNGRYITYFKNSAAVEDFLTMLGAPVAAMAIMSAKIEKDMVNSVNRQVNCDTANVAKTVEAAAAQINAIQIIEEKMGLHNLPDKLRKTAELRLQNPELSISQLVAASEDPLTKSCLGHRLKKLIEISESL